MSKNTHKPQLIKPIVMVGMMGAGKSAIGSALSDALGLPFLDTDAEIEAAAAMSIAEIFARDGEDFFRARESEVLARLMKSGSAVISTGGGAFLRDQNRAVIAQYGTSLWLKADLEILWERVAHKDTRPLLRTSDPKATLSALLAERSPHYAQASLVIEAERYQTIEEMTARVIDLLDKHGLLRSAPAAQKG